MLVNYENFCSCAFDDANFRYPAATPLVAIIEFGKISVFAKVTICDWKFAGLKPLCFLLLFLLLGRS